MSIVDIVELQAQIEEQKRQAECEFFKRYEKTCGLPGCDKHFLVTSGDYVYKIRDKIGTNCTLYFCCYSHWREAQKKLKEGKKWTKRY